MSGVPWGTVLTPLLYMFLCYINDLPKNVSSKVRLYAGDVLLYNTNHTKEDLDCLTSQEDLNTLQLWANKWQIMLSLTLINKKKPTLNSLFYMTTIFSKRSK